MCCLGQLCLAQRRRGGALGRQFLVETIDCFGRRASGCLRRGKPVAHLRHLGFERAYTPNSGELVIHDRRRINVGRLDRPDLGRAQHQFGFELFAIAGDVRGHSLAVQRDPLGAKLSLHLDQARLTDGEVILRRHQLGLGRDQVAVDCRDGRVKFHQLGVECGRLLQRCLVGVERCCFRCGGVVVRLAQLRFDRRRLGRWFVRYRRGGRRALRLRRHRAHERAHARNSGERRKNAADGRQVHSSVSAPRPIDVSQSRIASLNDFARRACKIVQRTPPVAIRRGSATPRRLIRPRRPRSQCRGSAGWSTTLRPW